MKNGLLQKNIKVSVVIRCKNEADSLEEFLYLLFEQTEMGFELIIVDNNSTDHTFKVLKNFPVACIVHIPDMEYSHALSCNLGMYVAQKDLVVLSNGHCLPVSRTWLADGLSNFRRANIVGIDGSYRTNRDGSRWERLGDIWQADLLKKRDEDKPLSTTNAIIRRKLWEKYPFDESLQELEDYDFSKEMLFRGFKTIKDPRFNVFHSHGLTRKQQERQNNRWSKKLAKLDERKRPRKTSSKVFSKEFWKNTEVKVERLLDVTTPELDK